ncbi:shwachman-Bodian-Diamond syndrome protein [Niveomyces insectorum RCEF 264]|uniref:Shwachman-Bodian-Diamond syndrome protein n=1 Tax=Niveomyces insectorum RCEF 264 TaxID=1081102 RepID=A0A167X2R8_9HYPO|nr:shwachman-Bodian-Diamond syndrome protein [Niveomyces insectorum RCEF 264]
MPRGEAHQNKVHLRGKDDDFVVFVDDLDTYRKWKTDSSVPLSHFVSTFQVFVTHKQGVQGEYNTAANGTLDNEFGTHVDEEVITKILKTGTLQETEGPERQGVRNESQGSRGDPAGGRY